LFFKEGFVKFEKIVGCFVWNGRLKIKTSFFSRPGKDGQPLKHGHVFSLKPPLKSEESLLKSQETFGEFHGKVGHLLKDRYGFSLKPSLKSEESLLIYAKNLRGIPWKRSV
jgi:hypothetical protein